MLQPRRRTLRVAGVAAAVLVMTAGAAGAANGGTGAALAPQKSRTVKFTETGAGAEIGTPSMSVQVFAVTDSLDGDGAVVANSTITGTSGTNTAIEYFANGVRRVKETFTFGAPDATGLIPLTGSGTCTGGTGVHKHEKCSYTFTATESRQANLFHISVTGTSTR
jgi:hypothetical protein